MDGVREALTRAQFAVKKALSSDSSPPKRGRQGGGGGDGIEGANRLRGWAGSPATATADAFTLRDFSADEEWRSLPIAERVRTVKTYERMVSGLAIPLSGLLEEGGGSGGAYGGESRIGAGGGSNEKSSSSASISGDRSGSSTGGGGGGGAAVSWLEAVHPLLPAPGLEQLEQRTASD